MRQSNLNNKNLWILKILKKEEGNFKIIKIKVQIKIKWNKLISNNLIKVNKEIAIKN